LRKLILGAALAAAITPALAGAPPPPAPWLACALARADAAPPLRLDPDGLSRSDRPAPLYLAAREIVSACQPTGPEDAARILSRGEITTRVIERLSQRSRDWTKKAREEQERRKSI